jgi:hypothetical protein
MIRIIKAIDAEIADCRGKVEALTRQIEKLETLRAELLAQPAAEKRPPRKQRHYHDRTRSDPVGQALYAWRQALPHGTLAVAADLLGLSQPDLSRYEMGRRKIPPEKVGRIEKITGIHRSILRPDVFPLEPKGTA